MKGEKSSIQYQIFAWVGFVVVLITLLNLFFNNLIMESIYLTRQEKDIINAYYQIKDVDINNKNIDLDYLYQFCSIRNVTLFVTNNEFEPKIYFYNEFGDDGAKAILEHIKEISKSGNNLSKYIIKEETLEENKDYQIVQMRDLRSNMDFLELRGFCDDKKILIRSSITSINENISIFNTFSSFMLLIGLTIGILFSWFLGKKFSKPIKNLTDISEEMINLNFDTKYNDDVNNEIDILGANFNELSDKLKSSLQELRDANNQLELDIKEKERINEMIKDFISNVSHELKTPIALIQGYAEAIKDGIGDSPEMNEYYADIIVDESQRMNKLVKQLIDLNQLESGNFLDLEDFDICSLISDIVETYSRKEEENKTKIKLNLEKDKIMVYSDEFKIEQIVINYITNAFNHLNDEKNIKINVFELDEENIKVEVFNSGKNIPEEELENIWLKFYKVDKSHSREYGGSGIGLSIVKAIMNSLNQDFGVKNVKDGVIFYFTVKKSINQ